MFRFFIVFIMLITVVGCQNVLEKPLGVFSESAEIKNIIGTWSGKDKSTNSSITIEQSVDDRHYKIRGTDGNSVFVVDALVTNLNKKAILNLDLNTFYITKNEVKEKLVNFTEPRYSLLGLYLVGEQLYVIHADMESFQNQLSDLIKKTYKLRGGCVPDPKTKSISMYCELMSINSDVLVLDDSVKLKQRITESFDKIFPIADAYIFEKKGKVIGAKLSKR